MEKEENKHLDVLDPTYPLFVEFKEKCPGTFKHSQAVMEMVKSVAQSLNLESIDLQIAAMYHDIGKICNSEYFSENQREENPHNELTPWISFQIITRHVSDGVLLLINNEDFSRKTIEIISQHHGTMILKQFLHKAGEDENEEKWRYKSISPNSIESAILMICDSVEATAQSIFQSHKEFDPKEIIESKINLLLDDGQLDNVVMRLGDLKKIKNALFKELEGSFPKRIDYDEDTEIVKKKKKADNK